MHGVRLKNGNRSVQANGFYARLPGCVSPTLLSCLPHLFVFWKLYVSGSFHRLRNFFDLHDAFLEGNSHHFSNFSVEFRGPVREHRPCLRSRRLLPSRRVKGFATRPVVHQSRHLIENFVEVLLHLTWKGSEWPVTCVKWLHSSIDFKWRVKVGMQQSLAFRWTFGEAKPLCPCQLHPQPKAWKLLVFLDHMKCTKYDSPLPKNDAVNVALSLTNIRIGTNFWRGRCLEAWVWK